jgi:Flp pilus assembly pilin Flp
MFGLFTQRLKKEGGFTAIEYGLIAAFTLILVSQLTAML